MISLTVFVNYDSGEDFNMRCSIFIEFGDAVMQELEPVINSIHVEAAPIIILRCASKALQIRGNLHIHIIKAGILRTPVCIQCLHCSIGFSKPGLKLGRGVLADSGDIEGGRSICKPVGFIGKNIAQLRGVGILDLGDQHFKNLFPHFPHIGIINVVNRVVFATNGDFVTIQVSNPGRKNRSGMP